MKYIIGRADEKTLMEIEFEASVKRPLSLRIENCFIKTYKPVMDDESYRTTESHN